MKTQTQNRCCVTIFEGDYCTRKHQCTRTANLVKRRGKWYCWQHDPVRIKEDNNKRIKNYEEKQNARMRTLEKAGEYPKAVMTCQKLANMLVLVLGGTRIDVKDAEQAIRNSNQVCKRARQLKVRMK
jgi:hypothetical protein